MKTEAEIMMMWKFDTNKLSIKHGDITEEKCDAIVNAANPRLAGGGGVDGAIHIAAGQRLVQACRDIINKNGNLPTGKAVTTPGFDLPAPYIIHTVGPIWRGGNSNEKQLLSSCYEDCLREAAKHNCTSISFPAVSCGVYGFPTELAAPIALRILSKAAGSIQDCRMIIHDKNDFNIWKAAAIKMFGEPD